jgi:hypothetical protein
MPKIHEETITVRLSKLTKNLETPPQLVTADLLESLAAVAEELVQDGIIIEVEKNQ